MHGFLKIDNSIETFLKDEQSGVVPVKVVNELPHEFDPYYFKIDTEFLLGSVNLLIEVLKNLFVVIVLQSCLACLNQFVGLHLGLL